MIKISKSIAIICFIFINVLFAKNLDSIEKVSLQLHWKYQFQFAGFIAAKEKGFYKDVGLDVELKEYEHGINIEEDVLTSKSNYGIYNSNILVSYLQDKPIKLLSSFFKRPALIIITKPDIKTPKDLIGKKIMAGTKKDFDFNFKNIFDLENVDTKDLKFVKHSHGIKEFIAGDVDAMTAFISDQPYKLDSKNVKYNIINPTDYGIYNLQLELFTSKDEVLKHPNRTKSFMDATIKGWEYALQNTDEIIDIIYKKYSKNIPKESLKYEAEITKRLILPNIYRIGSFDKNFLNRQLDIFKNNYEIKNDKALEDFLYLNKNKQTSISLTPQEKQYLKKYPVLKVHNEINWPPFNFNENGIAKGYSIDYMNLLASKLDIKVEYISGYSWSEFIDILLTSKLDLIINISKNKEREKTISFTDVFLSAKNAIYTNVKSHEIHTLKDLENKTIAMPKGFFAQKFLEKNNPNIKQILVKDSLEALKLLSLGKVDATIGKKVVLDYIIENNMISNVIATQYIEDEKLISHMRLGSDKKDKILADILKKAQKLVTKEETKKIKSKWFGAKMSNKISNNLGLTKEEELYLKKKNKITMCVDPDWMPFEKIQNGEHIGLASDFVKLISKKINTPINLVETSSWSESIEKAKNRECDIFSMASITPERKKYMNFTSPYLSTQIVIATKTSEIYLNDLDGSLDKIFGVVKGYSLHETLKNNYPNIKLVEVDSLNDGLEKVLEGKIFGYLDNSMVIMYAIQKKFLGTVSIVGKINKEIEYRVHTRNDEKILNEIFEKAVLSITTDEKQKIENKWLRFE